MSDSVNPRLRDNPVVHRKSYVDYIPVPLTHPGGSTANTGDYTVYTNTAYGQHQWGDISSVFGSQPLNINLDGSWVGGYCRWASPNELEVINNLYKRARKELVQGLVNLIEARQFPSAIGSLADLLPKKKQNYLRFFKSLGSFRGSKRLSSAYLAYQFGIAPVLSDIVKVNGFLSDFHRQLTRFESGARNVVSQVFPGSLQVEIPSTVAYGQEKVHQIRLMHPPQTRYTLVYRYRRAYGPLMTKIQFILQRLGFLSLANAAWELTPWSFVVDWFFDTSGILMQIDDLLGLDPIETVSCVKSNKWQAEVDIFGTTYGLNNSNIGWTGKGAVSYCSYYSRLPLGRSTYVGPSNRFGKKQLLLSVALARQRLRR
jgi:hypothetical protein